MRTSTVIEEVSIGISHSSIGEKIARRWNLPEYLVETIQWHHAPLNCNKEYQDIVYLTYLANKMCSIEEKKYDYYFLEEEVLQRFNLDDEKAFNDLHEEMKKKYNDQNAPKR